MSADISKMLNKINEMDKQLADNYKHNVEMLVIVRKELEELKDEREDDFEPAPSGSCVHCKDATSFMEGDAHVCERCGDRKKRWKDLFCDNCGGLASIEYDLSVRAQVAGKAHVILTPEGKISIGQMTMCFSNGESLDGEDELTCKCVKCSFNWSVPKRCAGQSNSPANDIVDKIYTAVIEKIDNI